MLIDQYPQYPLWTDRLFQSEEFQQFKVGVQRVISEAATQVRNHTVGEVMPELLKFQNDSNSMVAQRFVEAEMKHERRHEQGVKEIKTLLAHSFNALEDRIMEKVEGSQKPMKMKLTLTTPSGETQELELLQHLSPVRRPAPPTSVENEEGSNLTRDVARENTEPATSSGSSNTSASSSAANAIFDTLLTSTAVNNGAQTGSAAAPKVSGKTNVDDGKSIHYPYAMIEHMTVGALMREWTEGMSKDATIKRPPLKELVKKHKFVNLFEQSEKKKYERRANIIEMVEGLVDAGTQHNITLAAAAVDEIRNNEGKNCTINKLNEVIRDMKMKARKDLTLDNLKIALSSKFS